MTLSDDDLAGLAHRQLRWNAPLSSRRAADLVYRLGVPAGASVLDLGCGWGELLLQIVGTTEATRGLGVDRSSRNIERALVTASARGLADSVEFVVGDAVGHPGQGDDVLAVGVAHAWGGSAFALDALRGSVAPGGRLLYGDGYWVVPPEPVVQELLGEQVDGVDGLVGAASAAGFRPLHVTTASIAEWDAFEAAWCRGLEQFAHAHPRTEDGDHAARVAAEHRAAYLDGYRGVLGFAYLVLEIS